MRGAWKPVLVWALASAALDGLVLVRGGGSVEPIAYAALPLALLVLLGLVVLRGTRPPARFLDGMVEGGAEPEVLEDDVDWTGARRIVARTAAGPWVVESSSGSLQALLFVQAPGEAEPAHVSGDPREAGRKAAKRG